MKVRKVTIKDIEQLTTLFNSYRSFYNKPVALSEAKQFLTERIENNDSEIFICENADAQFMGFVQLYPLFSSTRMKKYWLLNDLFVAKAFRGQKAALALIEKAKELVVATKACGMYLETGKDNEIGNSLYPRAGFKKYDGVNFYEWEVDNN